MQGPCFGASIRQGGVAEFSTSTDGRDGQAVDGIAAWGRQVSAVRDLAIVGGRR